MPITEISHSEKAAVPPRAPKQAALPSFKTLASAALTVNAVPIAFFLLGNHPRPALSLLGGFLVGLVMHGLLYLFVSQGMSLFVMPAATGDPAQNAGSTGGFAALMFGKFIAIGALLFLMVGVLKASVLWLVIGVLLTQIAMAAATVARMIKTKVTD